MLEKNTYKLLFRYVFILSFFILPLFFYISFEKNLSKIYHHSKTRGYPHNLKYFLYFYNCGQSKGYKELYRCVCGGREGVGGVTPPLLEVYPPIHTYKPKERPHCKIEFLVLLTLNALILSYFSLSKRI